MDFVMNYNCSYQDEVQSVLSLRLSITLFIAAVMRNETCKTMLICCDTLEKEKNTVRVYIETIYIRSADYFAQLIKIHMVSTKVMVILEKDICRNIIWDDHAPQIPGI